MRAELKSNRFLGRAEFSTPRDITSARQLQDPDAQPAPSVQPTKTDVDAEISPPTAATQVNLKEARLLNSGTPVPIDASVVSFKTAGTDGGGSASAGIPQDDPWAVVTGLSSDATPPSACDGSKNVVAVNDAKEKPNDAVKDVATEPSKDAESALAHAEAGGDEDPRPESPSADRAMTPTSRKAAKRARQALLKTAATTAVSESLNPIAGHLG